MNKIGTWGKITSYLSHILVIVVVSEVVPYESQWLFAVLLIAYCTWYLQSNSTARTLTVCILGLGSKMNVHRLGWMNTVGWGDREVFDLGGEYTLRLDKKESHLTEEGRDMLIRENKISEEVMEQLTKSPFIYADSFFFGGIRLLAFGFLISLS